MLPLPASFVVDTDGYVRARFVDPDYRKRMAIEDVLQAVCEPHASRPMPPVVDLLPAPDRAFRSFHLDTEGAVDRVGKEAGSGRPPHTWQRAHVEQLGDATFEPDVRWRLGARRISAVEATRLKASQGIFSWHTPLHRWDVPTEPGPHKSTSRRAAAFCEFSRTHELSL
jgi:hypothetical protein